jgi:ERCC4-type nuclease
MNYYYTKRERKELLNSLKILVDTREKKNRHITDYLDRKGVKYKSRKLDYGDYSFMIPANEGLGIAKDIYFNDEIAVERKANLTELSNNFTHDRTQFENELIRSSNGKMILLVENPAGYKDIIDHNYRTKYKPESFIGTLHSFKHRYDIDTVFIDPQLAGNFIYYSFYYFLRENLK